jgi:hypothetical protein
MFDKMPLFAVVGLNMASDKDKKELAKDLMYLVPLVGS